MKTIVWTSEQSGTVPGVGFVTPGAELVVDDLKAKTLVNEGKAEIKDTGMGAAKPKKDKEEDK